MEMDVKDICCMKEKFVSLLKTELEKGIEHVDAKEAGEVVDMIKDLAEAEKYCYEAHYYHKVTEAMEEKNEGFESERYGYPRNPIHKKGHGVPRESWERPYMDQAPYIREYLNDEDEFEENMRMGYPVNGRILTRNANTGRYESGSRHGKAYGDWERSRRGYMATKSDEDHHEMNVHAQEHVSDVITTVREIWKTADQDLKKRMKADFQTLINEMTV